jgi:hypothetical protein
MYTTSGANYTASGFARDLKASSAFSGFRAITVEKALAEPPGAAKLSY